MTDLRWMLLALPLTLVACKNEGGAEKDSSKSDKSDEKKDEKKDKAKKDDSAKAKSDKPAGSAESAVKTPAETAKPTDPVVDSKPSDKAVTAPAMQSYKLGAIKKIDDSCASPWVIVANAPETVGVDYEWKWSKQAILANGQFHVTGGDPAGPGEVSFQVHEADATMSSAYVLVAHCHDGATCNYLAAMFKAVVKTSNPQVICGALPANIGSAKKKLDFLAGGPEHNVPAEGDTISLCARLSACNIAMKPETTEDIGMQCQKAPGSFKTKCATHYPCAEVEACLGN